MQSGFGRRVRRYTGACTVSVALLAGCSEYAFEGGAVIEGEPSSPTSLSQLASAPLKLPVARAGADRDVAPLDVVTLDGTNSYDLDGLEIVDYVWTLTQAPEGSTTELSDVHAAKPELFVDLAGEYKLTLTVENAVGSWDPTPDEIVIHAIPVDRLYVELSWDAGNDLDLHLLTGGMSLFGYEDCNYCNMTPHWAGPGPSDDPSLDWDAIQGYGPETITIDEPANGVYAIGVHYYGEGGLDRCKDGCDVTRATVHLYVGGELVGKFVRTLSNQGDLWSVATVTWDEDDSVPARILEVDALGSTRQTYCHP